MICPLTGNFKISHEDAKFSRICISEGTAWILLLPWGSCALLISLTLGVISHFPENRVSQTFVSAEHLEGLLKSDCWGIWVSFRFSRSGGGISECALLNAQVMLTLLLLQRGPRPLPWKKLFLFLLYRPWQAFDGRVGCDYKAGLDGFLKLLQPRLASFPRWPWNLKGTSISISSEGAHAQRIKLIYLQLFVISYHHLSLLWFWSNSYGQGFPVDCS